MKRLIIRRLLWMLLLLFCISIASYLLVFITPGSVAEAAYETKYSSAPTEEQLERFNREYGFDRSLARQYLDWLGHALRGDLGKSLLDGDDVLSTYFHKLWVSLELFLTSQALAIVLALTVGTYSAWKEGGICDRLCRFLSSLGIAVPAFWFGALLIFLLAIRGHLLPVSGYGKAVHFILPTLTLGLTGAASLVRIVRTSVLETLGSNYVRTARAKGLKERRVVVFHALRNAMVPIVTALGHRVHILFGGSAVIEAVFAWPGLGSHFLRIANSKDIFSIQGFVLISAVFFTLTNLGIDLLYMKLDPESKAVETT